MATDQTLVHGTTAPGFEAVRSAFERNFREGKELGAACAVYYKGELVVDLWGGIRDMASGAPWEADTMVPVMSTTKGFSSIAVALAHSRGLIDYDEKVATYWPEFAQNGKADVTVRQLLGYQAGLCAIDEPLDLAKIADPDVLAEALARQKPAWEPGTQQGYHAFSHGWYQSELIRRVDPKHRTIGKFFHEEIAQPLGVDFYIGLPPQIPRSRIAAIKPYKPWQLLFNLHKVPWKYVKNFLNKKSLTYRTFFNPPGFGDISTYNDVRVQAIEVPAASGIGSPRGMARAYSEFATGGRALGLRPETLAELAAPGTRPSGGTYDQVVHMKDIYWSLGFVKPSPIIQFGPTGQSFGDAGGGGSFAFADPVSQVGFAYAPNRTDLYLHSDPREKALRDATYRCIAQLEQQ
ncbi:MAG: serine hydrolase domain-containing protein, partial [Roseiflexaceae bacterium]